MEIIRYNIPKLPRNKYKSVGGHFASVTSTDISNGIISNVGHPNLYDGLDSMSIESGLTANQGRVLNDKITNLKETVNNDTELINKLKNNIDCINVTSISGNTCFTGLSEALVWLVNNKISHKYSLHTGMQIKYRDYNIGRWFTYIFVGSNTDWINASYNLDTNWRLISTESILSLPDCINITSLTGDCPDGLQTAINWLSNDAPKHGYKLHTGMQIKYREFYTGIWRTYLYRGSSTDWNSTDYRNTNNWQIEIIDNLTTDSSFQSLSAKQGKKLQDTKLSKTTADTANGLITFDKGLISNGNIAVGGYATNPNYGTGIWKDSGNKSNLTTDKVNARSNITTSEAIIKDTIKSDNYLTDKVGWAVYKDNKGKYNLDIDNANIRGRLDVEVLQIEEAKYVGGKLYCTKAGIRCNKVEDKGEVYRCYFKTTNPDGVTIHNQFQVTDLAFCQTFNNNKLRRYWRFVQGVGTDYIDLSKDECEKGSDVPEVGDDIVQLGHYTDVERQGAIIIEPLEINIYEDIDDFILPAPKITLNPKLSTIKGKFINEATNEDITTTFSNMGNKIEAVGKKIKTDASGNITNISKSGLVTTSEYAGLFTQNLNSHNEIITQSKLGTYNYVNNGQLQSAIAGVTENLKYDSNGNITNINKSGLVATSEFAGLFSAQLNAHKEVVTKSVLGTYNYINNGQLESAIAGVTKNLKYDSEGNLTNINKSGLVATSEYAQLFTQNLNSHNEVITQANIGTYNYVNGNQMSSAIEGVTKNLKYDSNGNLTNIDTSKLVLKDGFAGLVNQTVAANDTLVTKSILSACDYITNGEVDSKIEAEASKVHYDASGNITNINKSGLVSTSQFSGLFSSQLNAHNEIVKQTQIAAFITEDEAGNLISNAIIEADNINFTGKTIINNNFKVDTQGNLDIKGKITTTEGKIGQFSITQKGLTNDAKNGLASILITDSRTEPEIGFSVGHSKDHVVGAYSRYQNVLDCSSEYGTAVKAYSRSGWGLIASKTKVEGLHLTPQYLSDADIADNLVLSTYVDFYIFGNTKPMTIYLPEPNQAGGKIYIFKKLGAGKVTMYGKIIASNTASVSTEFIYNGNIPKQFISDGVKWFEI